MPEGWIKSTSVNLAAALSTLGVPVQVDQTTDAKSGRGWKTLLLGLEALPTDEIGLVPDGDEEAPPPAQIKTRVIAELVRTGKLESADPTHPVLDALRALHNRERLLDWTQRNIRHCIAKTSRAPRSHLIPGEEAETWKKPPALFKTGDMKVVAALAVFGVPVSRIEGREGQHTFYCANTGHDLGVPPMDANATVLAWRNDTLPPDHPFRWSMQALINRERILDFMFHQKKSILIRKPGSSLAAIVSEDANDVCMDKVQRHFAIR